LDSWSTINVVGDRNWHFCNQLPIIVPCCASDFGTSWEGFQSSRRNHVQTSTNWCPRTL